MYYGTSLFGRVDEVPKHCYVATAFLHLYGFPLIPIRTYVVRWDDFPENFGRPIPFSGKSILVAWFRALLIAVPIIAAVSAFALYGDRSVGARNWRHGSAIASIVTLVLLAISYWPAWRRASMLRAQELASILGLSLEELQRHAVSPERPRDTATTEQAQLRDQRQDESRVTKNRWREVPPGPTA